jgi:DNA-binding PadR family transcriptional regulator
MTEPPAGNTSSLEYYVLLAMAAGPLYGYGIKSAVETESGGAVMPRAGSLYRVLARLITSGLVVEAVTPEPESPHPGRARKYYGLTETGREVLGAEARRLRQAAALAEDRLGMAGDRR